MKDFVYIIEFGPKLVKIGRSRKPDLRVLNVSSASGRKSRRVWVSPPIMNAGDVERRAHASVGEFRGHGEWFNCPFDLAVERSSRLISEQDLWTDEKDDERSRKSRADFDSLIHHIFPSSSSGNKLNLDAEYRERFKREIFDRSIENYVSFLEVDSARGRIFDEQIALHERAVKSLDGLSIDTVCELIFLRDLGSEEYLKATMMSGVYMGHVTENCMMVLGDAEQIPGMMDVIEQTARERLAARDMAQ